jgi:hypothetical protein
MTLNDLVYGPQCSSLAARDRAILIEQALDESLVDIMRAGAGSSELAAELDATREMTDSLAGALDQIFAAHQRVRDAQDDVALVGSLVVPGPKLVKAVEDFERVVGESKQVRAGYENGDE